MHYAALVIASGGLIKLDNYTLEATRPTNFDFDPATSVVWVNTQFVTVFFVFFAKPTRRTLCQIWTNKGLKRVVPRGSERCGPIFGGKPLRKKEICGA